jgi:glycine betaine/proline transport system substrate-binding protein
LKRNTRQSRTRAGGLYILLALLFVAVISAGCSAATGGSSSPPEEDRELTIAHSSWEESEALALLTKAVLEEEFEYDVSLEEAPPEDAFEAVADGEADAFQGIWRPVHNGLVAEHEGDIDMLGQWLLGTTRASLAGPAYMDIRRIEEIEDAETALVLEGGSSGAGEIPAEIFEKHGLEPSVQPDSPAMMEEAERLYEAEEAFVMLAYSPHWMNLEYDLDYLEGGGLLEEVNRPATLHSAARAGLSGEDPLAHVFLEEITLTVPQMESLQLAIHDSEEPSEAAHSWAESNAHVVGVWVYIARERAS